MAELSVGSLIVSLGLDPKEFNAGVARAFASLSEPEQKLREFLEGFQTGFSEAIQETTRGAAETSQSINDVAAAAQNAGEAITEAGGKGRALLRETARQAEQTGSKIKDAGAGITQLGNRWGGMLKGIITQFAAPVLGAFATGAMVNSYFSGVAQVAQMSGMYTSQMEEWRKKRELLSRVTREDVELYRDGKLALLDFNFAMASLSTTIMRALAPELRTAINILHDFSDWTRDNEHNIVRFLRAVAIVVTAAIIPAFVKWGLVLLANPITWIVLALLALVLVLDDLMTYIHGGNSLLAGFWSRFGSGKEVAEKLSRALESLKRIAVAAFKLAFAAAKAFFTYFGDTIGPIADIFENTIKLIASLLEGDFAGALDAAINIAEAFKSYFLTLFSGLGRLIVDLLAAAMENVGDFFAEFFQGLIDDFLKFVKSLVDKIPDFLKSDSLVQWSAKVDAQIKNTTKDFTGDAANEAGSKTFGPSAPEAVSAAVSPSYVTNKTGDFSANTTVHSVNVYTQATEATEIARDIVGALTKGFSSSATAAADGGVR